MRSWFGALLVVAILGGSARAETFDVTTYTPPSGWTPKTEPGVISYSTVDAGAKTFCQIQLYAARRDLEFAASWHELVQSSFAKAGKPTLANVEDDHGWKIQIGGTQTEFGGRPTTVVHIVASKDGKRVAIVYAATADCSAQLDAFTKSLTFAGGAPAAAPAAAPATSTWKQVVKPDWVEVTSTAGKVLIHYPNPITSKYDSVLANSVKTAWNTLVAPHYSSISNLEVKPIQSYQSISFAEADAVEKDTNRKVHVVLFRLHDDQSRNRYLELVTDSKAAFERAFGPYHKDEFHWDKLTQMGNYDRFDLTKEALAGTWDSTTFAGVSYFYASGRSAGADSTSIASQFTFDGKGGYSSDWAGASGAVGNAKFARQQYRGEYTIEGGIKLTLTHRFNDKPETYTAYFQAVKGGNALVLIDSRSSVTYLGKSR